ncbi:uncharacterized protein LOC104895369 isoform X2 [Beta vulgaris subsp. vulgaris]|uniref:uncharacterized protein LOC104895369 isoform X2 n=1 Tax=Beta vulgaris subsp. vulgaris TaxID=3555 RepID=UPI002036C56B|nr:uncharacterized protein LOC104895369 isoform X2 [Beta vulgaris subsp. vulgaris]
MNMVTYYQNWVSQLLEEYQFEYPWIPCTSILCGIFTCRIVYNLSQLISGICFKHYPTLPKMKQVEWDNRAISTLHAIFITALSIYLAFWSDLFSDDLQRGPVLYRSSASSSFVLGVFHHLLSMGALAYGMLTGLGQFYAYMVLLSETTTPGINLRWYLDAVGMKKSKAYVFNGVAIFLTWLVARILLFMYVFYHLYVHYDQIKQLPLFGYYLVLIAPCVLGGLNLMWFSKITKGMIKTLATKMD